MTDSDLHSLLVASLTARLERARAAADDRFTSLFDGTGILNQEYADGPRRFVLPSHLATFIAANDPATEIRRVEAALRVVQRHQPTSVHYEPGCCAWCCDHDGQGLMPYPCDDIRDLAAGEGIEVGTDG